MWLETHRIQESWDKNPGVIWGEGTKLTPCLRCNCCLEDQKWVYGSGCLKTGGDKVNSLRCRLWYIEVGYEMSDPVELVLSPQGDLFSSLGWCVSWSRTQPGIVRELERNEGCRGNGSGRSLPKDSWAEWSERLPKISNVRNQFRKTKMCLKQKP